jgi:hypothetical protein
MYTGRLASGLAASLFLGSLVAFGVPSVARADDSPSPNVARLSLSQGSVAVQRSGSTTNVAGSVNTPLNSGDALTTAEGGRAEVQFDGTSVLRMDQNAQVKFANLDPSNRTIQLAQGTVSLDQFQGSQDQTEIDTPSASIRAATDGRYRVTVDQSGATYISTRSGSADVLLPQGTQQVAAGTTMLVTGTAANPSFSIVGTVAVDSFDLFNEQRDDALIAALGNDDNVPTQVAAGDLNDYGSWTNDPAYGQVWVPNANQTAGWAPYRDGNWTWEASFGWTWVGSEPWGWAPYHYGRWFYDRHYGGWCWYPSAFNVGWAPALVGFVSFGGGFDLALGFGGLGWVPLGPNEAYHPWYGYDRGRGWHSIADYRAVNGNYRNLARGGSFADGRGFAGGHNNRALSSGQIHSAVAYRGAPSLGSGAHDYASFGTRVLPSSQRQTQAWGRFTTARGNVGARVGNDTRTNQYARPSGQRNDQTFGQGRPQSQNQGDPWARFNSTRGNFVPRSTGNGGNRQYSNGGDRQYSNGGDRRYSAPQQQRQYSTPQQQQRQYYSAPQQQQRQYWAPQQQQRQYSAPQQQQRQYWAPQQQPRQYSAPQQQRQYSAPPRSSSSSGRHDSGNSGSRGSSDNRSSGGSRDHSHR